MSALALATAALLGAFALAVQLLDRRRSGSPRPGPEGARWAKARELSPLVVPEACPGRLTLGHHGRRLLAAEAGASLLVVGPNRVSYKTSGLVIPAILEWPGPVLATSVKTDAMLATIEQRRTRGEAMVFDPVGVSGIESVKASPLSGCGTYWGAREVAHRLAGAARTRGGLADADFWHAAAEKLLAPLLFAAAHGGEMAHVIRWLNEESGAEPEVTEWLEEIGEPNASGAWRAAWHREERQRSSIFTTAETVLAAYEDPRVLAASAEAEYTPQALLDGGSATLYLCAPEHEHKRLGTLFAGMIGELVAEAYERSAKTGRPIDPPLLLVLDEAANIAPLPNLAGVASTGAGQGIQLLTVLQDLAQAEETWGRGAQTVINNHRAKLFAGGSSDRSTLHYLSHVAGQASFRQQSRTAERDGRSSHTESTTWRELVPPNVARGGEPKSALLMYGHLPPTWIGLQPWFEQTETKAALHVG